MPGKKPKTLSMAQLAERLDVSSATAWRLVNEDHAFPGAHRVRRGAWRIPVTDVEAYERRQQITKTA